MNRISCALAMAALAALVAGCTDRTHAAATEDEHVGTTSAALTVFGSGWSLVNSGGTATQWSYDSGGGTVVGSHYGTGGYQVDFNGIPNSNPSIAHVTAFGGTAHCKVGWGHLGDSTKSTVLVNCYTAAGTLTDSGFIVFIDARAGNTSSNKSGFLTVSGGSAPTVSNEWNWSGGTSTVTWNGDEYVIQVAGVSYSSASAQVTAIGLDSTRCKVEAWGTAWAAGKVWVKCFDTLGRPAPGSFDLSYLDGSEIPDNDGGHTLIKHGVVDTSFSGGVGYAPCSAISFSAAPSGSQVLVSMTNAGPVNGTTSVVPLVTAQGSDNSYCNVTHWSVAADGTVSAGVACMDGSGTPINASSVNFATTFTSRFHWHC